MDKFHFNKVMQEAEKTKRKFINGVKHKLQFGGLGAGEFDTARWLLKTAQIGHRYVSSEYRYLVPVVA